MEELCDRIKNILSSKVIESAVRQGEDPTPIEIHDRLDGLMDEMADFLVEKFNDVWGI